MRLWECRSDFTHQPAAAKGIYIKRASKVKDQCTLERVQGYILLQQLLFTNLFDDDLIIFDLKHIMIEEKEELNDD